MRGRALLFALLACVAACGRDMDPPRPARATIRPQTFAVVIAELAAARAELLPDTAAYRRRRDQILAQRGVTAEQLRAFGEAYGSDEDVLQGVYRIVRQRIDTLFGAGAVVPPSTGVAPPAEPQAEPASTADADTGPAPADTAPAPADTAPSPADTAPAPTDTAAARADTTATL